MKNLIMWKQGEASFVRWIKKRIKNNLNFLALASGSPGIGKSWAMISVAQQIDPTFEPRQVAFSFRGVMEIINSDWFKGKQWKIIVFDEAQCDIGSRQWQSLTNRLMNFLLSTFRHQNIIFFFTSPYADFLDIQSRKLLHCIFEIKGHSRKSSKTTIRPKLQQYNSKMQKWYEHSLHIIRDKKVRKLVNWQVKKPPRELIEPYEKAKAEFTDNLNQQILKQLEEVDKKNEQEKPELNPDSMQPLMWETAQSEKFGSINELRELVSKKKGTKISQTQFSRNVQAMKKKGYNIRDYLQKAK